MPPVTGSQSISSEQPRQLKPYRHLDPVFNRSPHSILHFLTSTRHNLTSSHHSAKLDRVRLSLYLFSRSLLDHDRSLTLQTLACLHAKNPTSINRPRPSSHTGTPSTRFRSRIRIRNRFCQLFPTPRLCLLQYHSTDSALTYGSSTLPLPLTTIHTTIPAPTIVTDRTTDFALPAHPLPVPR